MTNVEVILGPPGCGKTTALMGLIREELRSGRRPEEIAAVTFTRAGAQEIVRRVASRLDQPGLVLPWARTIHATAYRLLQIERGRMMDAKHWRAFAKAHAYVLTDLMDSDPDEHGTELPQSTHDDVLRHAWEWGRSRCLTPDGILQRYTGNSLAERHFRTYVERYTAYKTLHHLVDFSDLLEQCLAWQKRPPVRVAFVDEAQDLAPLQIKCVEAWFGPCERSVIVGDADQAIFAFAGADPAWLTGLARQHSYQVLDQSYRVPAGPHALARAIITQNRDRVDAVYKPRPVRGDIDVVALEPAIGRIDPDETTFVLARNIRFLVKPAELLFARGVPYEVEKKSGGPSPYRREKLVAAIRAACAIEIGEVVTAGAVVKLVDFVFADGVHLGRGAKTALRALDTRKPLHTDELTAITGCAQLVESIMQHGPLSVFQKDIEEPERDYFARVLERYDTLPRPKVVLTTIHGSKGREADHVLVRPDMLLPTWREYETPAGAESEHRVFYVAVTRARERLTLVQPDTPRYFYWPHFEVPDLPSEAEADPFADVLEAPPAAAHPTIAHPTIEHTAEDLGLVEAGPEAGTRWRLLDDDGWVEAWCRNVVVCRSEADRAAAAAAEPRCVIYTETEYAILMGLALDEDTYTKVRAQQCLWNLSLPRALTMVLPTWRKRLETKGAALGPRPLS